MVHFIQPNKEYFTRFTTGSVGPFAQSGSMDMHSVNEYLIDNAEWLYATGVPQTRINWIGVERGMTDGGDTLNLTGSNLIYTDGPFIMNLGPEGDTMPLYVKILAESIPEEPENDSGAYMRVHLRQYGIRGGIKSSQEIGSFQLDTPGASPDFAWYEVTGVLVHPVTDQSRSVILAPRTTLGRDYPIQSRTSREVTGFNTTSRIPLFYLDLWAVVNRSGSDTPKRIVIAGMYAQEISLSGAL
jgi:hypothetical protein